MFLGQADGLHTFINYQVQIPSVIYKGRLCRTHHHMERLL